MESRKNHIISLAFKLIQEKGFVDISYDDLSKPFGVNHSEHSLPFRKKGRLRSRNPGVNDGVFGTAFDPYRFIAARREAGALFFPIGCLGMLDIYPLSSLQTDFE